MLRITGWHHQVKTFSALLALCAGNSPVTGEFPSQRPVTRRFDVFFDLRLNKRLSKNRNACNLRRHRAHYDVTAMNHAASNRVAVRERASKTISRHGDRRRQITHFSWRFEEFCISFIRMAQKTKTYLIWSCSPYSCTSTRTMPFPAIRRLGTCARRWPTFWLTVAGAAASPECPPRIRPIRLNSLAPGRRGCMCDGQTPWNDWCLVPGLLRKIHVNNLRPRQNGRHFPDDIFKCIFMNENVWISIKISLKFVLKDLINNIPA